MFVVCVIQHMHVVSELSTFFDGDGGGGVGGGEWQWYLYVCVIRYMQDRKSTSMNSSNS